MDVDRDAQSQELTLHAGLRAGAVAEIGAELEPLERQLQSLYVPVAHWLQTKLTHVSHPYVLGVSGPQGGGKSTLAAALVGGARALGLRAIALSIDDVYLTRADQVQLAQTHPVNPYLAQRGYPGTHDVALGTALLDTLRAGEPTQLPRYDKTAHAGLGDRASEVRTITEPQDLIILEGWMLGFTPHHRTDVAPALRTVDTLLEPYKAWIQRLDALVVLRASAERDIVSWRVEAERKRRERGLGAMSEAAATAYIETCLPAYRAYVPALWQQPPVSDGLRVSLGPDRAPLEISQICPLVDSGRVL